MLRAAAAAAAAALLAAARAPIASAQNPPVDFEQLNAELRKLAFTFDIGQIPSVTEDYGFGISATVEFNTTVSCGAFGIGAYAFSGEEVPEGFALDLEFGMLELRCSIGVCFKTTVPFDEPECGGTLSAVSTPESQSRTAWRYLLTSPTDQAELPLWALEKEQRICDKRVRLDGIKFEGKDIGRVGGGDVTDDIVDTLNEAGGDIRTNSIKTLEEAFCEALRTYAVRDEQSPPSGPTAALAASFANLASKDATMQTAGAGLDDPSGSFSKSSLDVLSAVAREKERALLQSLPEGVELIDLREEGIVQLAIVPGPLPDGNSVNLLVSLLDLFDSSMDPQIKASVSIINQLLGFETGGFVEPIENLDVLGMIQSLAGDLPIDKVLKPEFALGDIFRLTLDLKNVTLSVDPSDKPMPANATKMTTSLGPLTFLVPTIAFGDLLFEGCMGVDAVFETLLFDSPVTFSVREEEICFRIKWDSFVAQVASMVPIDEARLKAISVGSLLRDPASCLYSSFYRMPSLAAVITNADALSLRFDGFRQAGGALFGDVANAVAPAYAGAIPALLNVLLSNSEKFVETSDKPWCFDASAPPPPAKRVAGQAQPALAQTAQSEYFDFSSGGFPMLMGAIDVGLVESVMMRLWEGETPSDRHVGSAYNVLRFTFPTEEGRVRELAVRADSLAFSGVNFTDVTVFNASAPQAPDQPDVAQILDSIIRLGDGSVPVQVEANLALVDTTRDTASGTNTSAILDRVKVRVSATSLRLAWEFSAKIFTADVNDIPLGEAYSLSCWVARMQPFGGTSMLDLEMLDLDVQLECIECTSPRLQDLAARLQNPQPVADMIASIQALVAEAAGLVEKEFAPENWDRTVDLAKDICFQPANADPLGMMAFVDGDFDTVVAVSVFLALCFSLSILVSSVCTCQTKPVTASGAAASGGDAFRGPTSSHNPRHVRGAAVVSVAAQSRARPKSVLAAARPYIPSLSNMSVMLIPAGLILRSFSAHKNLTLLTDVICH